MASRPKTHAGLDRGSSQVSVVRGVGVEMNSPSQSHRQVDWLDWPTFSLIV